MKQKISISVERDKIKSIEKLVNAGKFRNKSHAFERGIDTILGSLEEIKQNDLK